MPVIRNTKHYVPKKEKKDNSDRFRMNLIILILVIQTFFLFGTKSESVLKLFSSVPEKIAKLVPDNKVFAEDTLQAKTSFSQNMVIIKPSSDKTASSNNFEAPEDEHKINISRAIRVNIQNGCGVSGLASKWSNILIDAGFDVRSTGNADRTNRSALISRVDDLNYAKYLAKKLGIKEENIITKFDKNYPDVDVTLILGNDYKTLNTDF
ncbi:MAG: LytR C-terminal domain-containing protein [Candidatus Delongbacteria bacterium]|nr:LytR C-terminal domain-containing protein [Candidatus Delongbacteria bacterium]